MLSAAQTIEILAEFPPSAPEAHLLWEAVVDIAEREDLGAGPRGARGIVPILGGQFRGAGAATGNPGQRPNREGSRTSHGPRSGGELLLFAQ